MSNTDTPTNLILTTAEDPKIIEICRVLRLENVPWEEVEQVVFTRGFRYLTGSRIHNGALSNAMLKAYPDLRKSKVREPKVTRNTGKRLRKVAKKKADLIRFIKFNGRLPKISITEESQLRSTYNRLCNKNHRCYDLKFHNKVSATLAHPLEVKVAPIKAPVVNALQKPAGPVATITPTTNVVGNMVSGLRDLGYNSDQILAILSGGKS